MTTKRRHEPVTAGLGVPNLGRRVAIHRGKSFPSRRTTKLGVSPFDPVAEPSERKNSISNDRAPDLGNSSQRGLRFSPYQF